MPIVTGRYLTPATLLTMPPKSLRFNVFLPEIQVVNFPEEEILKTFAGIEESKAFVVMGFDIMDLQDDLRSFIFSARKFFEPYHRPPIVLYTLYYMDELKKLGWGGVYSEILQYGNVILKCGRQLKSREPVKYYPQLGVRLRGMNHEIHDYTLRHQYE